MPSGDALSGMGIATFGEAGLSHSVAVNSQATMPELGTEAIPGSAKEKEVPPQPFILGKGLPAVPAKLANKIQKGEFVDMAELLKDNIKAERRREKVLAALQWLVANNPFYANITINLASVQQLPQDGIPDELLQAVVSDEEDSNPTEDSGEAAIACSHLFLPLPKQTATEDDAIRATIAGRNPIDWPYIGDMAINEFRTPGLASQAFPTLFPYGTGDPTCPGRQRPVTYTEAFKHLTRYAVVVNGTFLWRFASHPRFPYWALNMKLRHQLISQTSVYFHHHPADANLTTEDLRDMVGRLSFEQLMSRLQRYAAKVQGSHPYWFQRYCELRTLIEQKGPPTFFWKVSSADNHWPELHSLMPHPPNAEDYSTRIHAVIDNPHITDWFFTTKLTDWVQHWLYDALGAEWHWYRYEYQARGSIHAHGCAKLHNDPGLCTLIEKAAAAWAITEEQGNSSGNCSASPQHASDKRDRIIREGMEAKALVLQYADWLVTTCNEALPDDSWCIPTPHPCAISIQNVSDLDEDYHNLTNTVERHTHCSTAYYLRRKSGQQDLQCRFDYPRPTQTSSTINFERLADGTIRATLTTCCNDPRVNSHNRLLLQNWRANVDLQIIVDIQACARYMAKYVAKGEPRSQAVTETFNSCVSSLRDDSDTRSALRRAIIRAVGERDFSAQETAHMLLSLPLISCSYSFITLSLTGNRRVAEDPESGELTLQQSLLDHYSTVFCSLLLTSTYTRVKSKSGHHL